MGKIVKKGIACILLLGLCVAFIWMVPKKDETWEVLKEQQAGQLFSEPVHTIQAEGSRDIEETTAKECVSNMIDEVNEAIIMDESGEKLEVAEADEDETTPIRMDNNGKMSESKSVGEEPAEASDDIGNIGRETQENTQDPSEESVGESMGETPAGSSDEGRGETPTGSSREEAKELVNGNHEEAENGSDADTSQEDSGHKTQEDSQAPPAPSVPKDSQEDSDPSVSKDSQGDSEPSIPNDSQEDSDPSVQEDSQETPDPSVQESVSTAGGENTVPGDICQSRGHVFQVSIWETPTCLKGGYYNNICERCGLVECVTQPALSHQVEDITIQEGNCMEDTIIRHRCKNCGQQIKSDTRFTPQIHQWSSTVVDGQQVTYCEWCGITQ